MNYAARRRRRPRMSTPKTEASTAPGASALNDDSAAAPAGFSTTCPSQSRKHAGLGRLRDIAAGGIAGALAILARLP